MNNFDTSNNICIIIMTDTNPYEVFVDSEDPFQQARIARIRQATQNMYKRQIATGIFGIVISVGLMIAQDEYKYVKVSLVFLLTILAIIAEYKLSNINDVM